MERSGALATELDLYEAQKDALLAEHEGQFVLIHDREIIGTYVAEDDALAEGYNRFGNVPFLVKRVDRIESPVNFVSMPFEM